MCFVCACASSGLVGFLSWAPPLLAKVDRLIELFAEFSAKVDAFADPGDGSDVDDEEEDEEDEGEGAKVCRAADRAYGRLLGEGGLGTLQQVAVIAATVCLWSKAARERCAKKLFEKGRSLAEVSRLRVSTDLTSLAFLLASSCFYFTPLLSSFLALRFLQCPLLRPKVRRILVAYASRLDSQARKAARLHEVSESNEAARLKLGEEGEIYDGAEAGSMGGGGGEATQAALAREKQRAQLVARIAASFKAEDTEP